MQGAAGKSRTNFKMGWTYPNPAAQMSSPHSPFSKNKKLRGG
jgi:hypothetical protein